ncbi:concanavalin A-like lectin/glucanase domain-containing protein [Gigaspora rosea]|uniref:Concanavalin A-like lectin/glucanase domain-containing protein n=1 Tax=Gigaspora rosea TaxID=44941 RepID=A0A397UFE7_9GLOM|nr:concanavalin A-like lectin/glucanase domain-containing protein [Gigaspora rosea]
MDDLNSKTPYNDIVLPTTLDIEEKSPFIDIDSSRLKVNYTNPDDYKAAIVRANHPISLQCGIFYFEVKLQIKEKMGQKYNENKDYEKNNRDESWECGYHRDDGYSFCSGDCVPYGPTFISGDIIGCYLNFINKIVFYTKNGINLGITCYLPDKFEGILYPCIGFRSQGGSIEVNFEREKFKYSAMTNEDICNKSKNALVFEHQEKIYFIMGRYENVLANLTDELTILFEKETSNVFELIYRGKIYFIMGKYQEALKDLSRVLEIESENTIALRYKGEINYMMK